MTKPHLNREHALKLLKEMLRIRRFEEKCAELYTQEKIRGFLHLYIGEEANRRRCRSAGPEAGRMTTSVATYREHGHALARGIPSMDGDHGGDVRQGRNGCSRWARRLHAFVFDAERGIFTVAMPSSAAVCRWRWGSPLLTS